jgi:hypothetical protein
MPHWWKYIALRGAASLLCVLVAIGCSHRDNAAPVASPPQSSSAGYAYNKSTDREESEALSTAQAAAEDDAASAPEPASAPAPSPEEAAPPAPNAPPARDAAPARDAPRWLAQSIAGTPGGADTKTRGEAAVVREPDAPVQKPAVSSGTERDAREPLLIYTAVLTLAVFGVDAALQQVEALARDAGGYLLERNDNRITVRIPAPRFRATLDGIGKLGDELHRQVSARDVSEEYADLGIRLRNAEVMRQRLEALLAKAIKIEEALAVERELERVAQTIEQIKGRLKVLGELITFSTITVNFQPRSVAPVNSAVALPFPWLRELGLNHLLSL